VRENRIHITAAVIGAVSVIAAAIITVRFSSNSSPASSPPPLSTTSSPDPNPSGSTPASQASSPAASSKSKLLFSGEVTLPRHSAVDVDQQNQPVVADQSGVTGTFDLFHDSGEVKSDSIRTHDGIYAYPYGKSSNAAYDVCSDYTGPNPSYNAYNPAAGVGIGSIFCFTTSDHRLAWASVKSVQSDNFTAVLEVRVWDKLVGHN
jgi:hypothetical protein